MYQVKDSEGRKILSEWLEMSVKEAEDAIINIVDEECNKLKYTEHDTNRIRRAIYKKMQTLPDEVINYYTQAKESEEI